MRFDWQDAAKYIRIKAFLGKYLTDQGFRTRWSSFQMETHWWFGVLTDSVELVNNLGMQGVEFQSLTESIDTTSSGGRLIFHIMAALAEFERSLISERTRAGMEAARLKGKHIGRPRKVKSNERKEIKSAFMRKTSISEIAKKYKISPRAVRAIVNNSSEIA
jgi:DNA invertase Pin-like site-specific DNA recombinase